MAPSLFTPPGLAHPLTSESEMSKESFEHNTTSSKRGPKFWLIFGSMCICLSLSALELFSVATALPTIAHSLNSADFSWIASAYAIASTAFLPISGSLAQTFGRQPALLLTIGLFALGSGICGGASTMSMLIAGRTIQGLGGGGIQSLTGIILADLVTLEERGLFAGLYGLTWCLGASIGPVIGGTLAVQGQWRWIFYLNLPIAFVACGLVTVLLDLPVPTGTYREKLMQMDWIGSLLIISSTAAYTIGFTWGGLTAPWGSATVLVPLLLGFSGLVAFIVYEATLARYPLVPFSLLTNMTSISGYIQTFCNTIITFAVVYFFPVYFQACKGASPVTSGVKTLAFASLALAAIITGLLVRATGRYRPQMWMGWILSIVALGLMSTLLATDALEKPIGCLLLLGFGVGVLHATPMYPIQAPLSVTQNAPAIAFMWFVRSFAGIWGITIGITVLQNELANKLPPAFIESVPHGTAIMYALIPEIDMHSPEIRTEIRAAFASSLAVLWRVTAGVSGAGLVASLFMKGLPLHTALDANWVSKDEEPQQKVV